MSVHNFVPDDFGVGIVVPVLKDRSGDFCCAEQQSRICIFGTKSACGTKRLHTPLFNCVQSKKAVTAV